MLDFYEVTQLVNKYPKRFKVNLIKEKIYNYRKNGVKSYNFFFNLFNGISIKYNSNISLNLHKRNNIKKIIENKLNFFDFKL